MKHHMKGSKSFIPALGNPWGYFIFFLVSNSLLSYYPLTFQTKIGIGLFGLALPFGLACFLLSDKPTQFWEKFKFLPSPWIGLGVFLLAIFLRFYRLTSLSVWPLYDEGMYGYYALELCRHWDWKFFFGPSQAPPFYLWGLGLWFKHFGVSLTTLWFFPALLSLLCVPIGYWAARQFFSKSFSIFSGVFLAFGFWPIYVGRFGVMTGLVLLGECLILGLLGSFLKELNEKKRSWKSIFLGFGIGLGFYTYLHWPILAAFLFATVFFLMFRRFKKRPLGSLWNSILFCASCLFALLPLLIAFFLEGAGQILSYLRHLSASSSHSLIDQLSVSGSYFASLLWGMDLSFHTYQPVWGGYLNPVMGAFFLVGLLECVFQRKNPLHQWLLGALVLFILPGALTLERATSRMVLVVPVLIVLAGMGLFRLLSTFSPSKVKIAVVLLVVSSVLDFNHLRAYGQMWSDMENWKGYEKSYARYQAYLELYKIAQEKGPGFIFSDFVPGLSDQTLSVADYNFNVSENPALNPDQACWAAILMNVHYQPFLKKRFPKSKAYWVSKNLNDPNGGWMLWVLPVTSLNRKTIIGWQNASRALGPFIEKNLCYISGHSYEEISRSLQSIYPAFQGDPLLESCYWEKSADVALKEVLRTGTAADTSSVIQCLNLGLKKGYPAAHLYRNLGVAEMMKKENTKARDDFKKSIESPLNFTDSARYLEIINSKSKNSLGKDTQ